MNKKKYIKGKIVIEIANLTPIQESHFEHLNIKVEVKGDMPASWLAHAIIALCESYKKEMMKRKAIIVE